MQKTYRSWRVNEDSHKLNQVVTPTATAVPGVFSLFEQLTQPLVLGTQLLFLTNAFFSSKPVNIDTRSSCFQLSKLEIHLHCLMSGINSLTPCHNLVCRNLDHRYLPQDITLIHYINDIMIIGSSNQKVARSPDLIHKIFAYQRGKDKPDKIQQSSISVKFLWAP